MSGVAEFGTSRWVPERSALGTTNAVLVARSRIHSVQEFPGPLSIKTVVEGRVGWKTGKREVLVDESSMLVLNDGEPYSMQIDSPEPVTTCCVFFASGFVQSIGEDVCRRVNERLDNGQGGGRRLSFLSCLQPCNQPIASLMSVIRGRALGQSPPIALDECFLELAFQLLLQHKEMEKQICKIPAIRVATRTELFARVARGREFLHAEGLGPIRLADAANAACLSPFHFQRTFVRAFGKSPSRYVTELRLERAAKLLQNGETVTDACLRVGFQSLGSFSVAFRKHFGVPPSYFRSSI